MRIMYIMSNAIAAYWPILAALALAAAVALPRIPRHNPHPEKEPDNLAG